MKDLGSSVSLMAGLFSAAAAASVRSGSRALLRLNTGAAARLTAASPRVCLY